MAMVCQFCGKGYPTERFNIGYGYCIDSECVSKGNTSKFVEVGYGKSGVDLLPAHTVTSEHLKNTGNRGRS